VPHKKEYRRQRVRHYGTPNKPKLSGKNAKIPIQNEKTNHENTKGRSHEKRKGFLAFGVKGILFITPSLCEGLKPATPHF
jgi:hypothetical protein